VIAGRVSANCSGVQYSMTERWMLKISSRCAGVNRSRLKRRLNRAIRDWVNWVIAVMINLVIIVGNIVIDLKGVSSVNAHLV